LLGVDLEWLPILVLVLLALASYFVVSFIFAPDPNYLSLQNYSTIIRFSDTALPAYFFAAAVFFTSVAKKPKFLLALAAVFVIFLVAAVPLYETYASSSMGGVNPFGLNYRAEAATLRDYVAFTHQGVRSYIVGVPYGWAFTPGVRSLQAAVYSTVPGPFFPSINYSTFVTNKWNSFYVFADLGGGVYTTPLPGYIDQLVRGHQPIDDAQYKLVSRKTLFNESGLIYVRIELAWKG
jgi:hypothetical protein